MKKIIIAISFTFLLNQLSAQTKISIDSISKHIGDSVTLCSRVYGVKSLDKLTFLNLGASHPNSLLTIVIFSKDYANFTALPAELYNNKKICITGILKEFKGKTEMVISKPEDIVIEE